LEHIAGSANVMQKFEKLHLIKFQISEGNRKQYTILHIRFHIRGRIGQLLVYSWWFNILSGVTSFVIIEHLFPILEHVLVQQCELGYCHSLGFEMNW
jgi:hypothetical protein